MLVPAVCGEAPDLLATRIEDDKDLRPITAQLGPAPYLQPNRAGGVLTKQGALPDIPAKHRGSLVACLLGYDALWDTGSSSRGRKAGSQRVTCHVGGVESGPGSVALQHERHRLGAESCCPDVAMAVHGAKGCSLDNARDLEHPE